MDDDFRYGEPIEYECGCALRILPAINPAVGELSYTVQARACGTPACSTLARALEQAIDEVGE